MTGPEDACQTRPEEAVAWLRNLDRLLAEAVQRARVAFGIEPGADPYRGLYLSWEDAERLLEQAPGGPVFNDGESEDNPLADFPALLRLGDEYGLSAFERNVIAIALAPELDLRYERLYGFLQDDVTRRRPTVALVLNLLCSTTECRLARRSRFDSNAPLIRHGLIHLVADPSQAPAPLLAHSLKLDDQVVRILLQQPGLDARLEPFCRLIEPSVPLASLPLEAATIEGLARLACLSGCGGVGPHWYLWGGSSSLRRQVAEALAFEAGRPLLLCELAGAVESAADLQTTFRLLLREAWWQDALLCAEVGDLPRTGPPATALRRLCEDLAEFPGPAVLFGERHRADPGMLDVPLAVPGLALRRQFWQAALAAEGLTVEDDMLQALAGRYCLGAAQIESAVAVARSRACWRGDEVPAAAELFAAARGQCSQELASLARKIEPRCSWDDIVLPDDTLGLLREICQRVEQRRQVLDQWGFDRKLSLGKGVTALFAGPSGSGKTMAAEVLARKLELDLYQIDLSGVVSKYIGETEKNLERIFGAAEDSSAILFFDEADALFGKRSEVRDSHDRYANIEISYLLQKMDAYEGVAVLATNLRQNLDEAFVRRLGFIVHFPFPDTESRRRIWRGIWPLETPLADGLDFELLASRFKLSGGNIRNIALAAAFFAAQDGGMVSIQHLLRAIQREYQKMGKSLGAAELNAEVPEPALCAPVREGGDG